jgi:hypothetical protein
MYCVRRLILLITGNKLIWIFGRKWGKDVAVRPSIWDKSGKWLTSGQTGLRIVDVDQKPICE